VPASDPERRDQAAGLAAIVLAGGRASRLGGADKPALVVGTRTLLAAVVSAAAGAGAGHVVVVGPSRPVTDAGAVTSGRIEFVREEPPGTGPVAGLRCGLAGVCAQWVAVLAADLPFLRAQHLVALLSAAGQPQPGTGSAAGHDRAPATQHGAGQSQCGAILIDDSGHPQWLAGCWPAAALRGRLADYRGGSMRGLLDPLRPVRLSYLAGPDDPPPWLDCDTPGDLSQAREWARQVP
jgi:molybdenum cofactor guanylyltransferase